jgi:hypothetical protein
MSACKHIEEMAMYLEDAKETEEPWLRWEYEEGFEWESLIGHPKWVKQFNYRRKQKTININGFEVPEPLRVAPKEGTMVYIVSITSGHPECYCWLNNYNQLIEKGICHLTIEASNIHTKALLSFTQPVTNKD